MPNELVQYAQKSLEQARTRFLYGLDKVPDDRLEWNPGGAAKNALQLAGKVAGFLGFLDGFIKHQAPPDRSNQPEPPKSREEAKNAVHAAFSQMQSTLAGLTEEDLQKTAAAPWGAVLTISEWVSVIATVTGYHQGQLNYLQLCYGDEDPNIPPEWGHRP